MSTFLGFVGRVLLALLFLVSGIGKIADIGGAAALLSSAGLPANFAWPVALFELVAGLALLFGMLTRLVSLLLAAFCLATAFFYHNNFVDPLQAAMLLKNLAIAGGLLCLCALDSLRWSYDAVRERRLHELAVRDAEARTHDAELRAARAEGATTGNVVDPHLVPRRRRWWL